MVDNDALKADLSAYSSISYDLRRYLSQIETLVLEFNEIWPERVQECVTYTIPFYGVMTNVREGKDCTVPVVPDEIEPIFLYGEEAIQEAKSAFSQFKWDQDQQHPATVLRVPGFISLKSIEGLYECGLDPTKPYQGTHLVNRINHLKRELHDLIKTSFPEGSRAVASRRIFPGYSMLQIYRKLHVLDYPIRQIAFTWAGTAFSSSSLTYREACLLVQESHKNRPSNLQQHEWDRQVQAELDAIIGYPNNEFRIRKPVAPHPRVQTYMNNQNKPVEMFQANLPVIAMSNNESIPVVRPLKKWERGLSLARSKQLQLKLVVSRLHLYVVL